MTTIPISVAPEALVVGTPKIHGPWGLAGVNTVSLDFELVAVGGIPAWTNPANYPVSLRVTIDCQVFDTIESAWVSSVKNTYAGGQVGHRGTLPRIILNYTRPLTISQARIVVSVNQNTTIGATGSAAVT